MEKDILQRIAEECSGYSKRQRAIGKYICENSDIVAFMTAQMLSEAAEVSESSVVRFARQLGFDGYTELRRALQQLIKERIATQEEAAEMESRELGLLVTGGVQGLQALPSSQNERALEQAFLLVSGAERLVVQAGFGMDGLDIHLASGLNLLGFRACTAPKGFSGEILSLDENAVLVCISGHYYSGLLGSIRYAKARNAGVLVLAEDETVPMRQYADAMLVGKGLAATAVLISALLSALEKSCGKNMEEKLAELNALHREYGTYEFTEN
ncbi:MAG: MurR/RpiR family transcriptional regulator [Candidatus Limivicinus sp.]